MKNPANVLLAIGLCFIASCEALAPKTNVRSSQSSTTIRRDLKRSFTFKLGRWSWMTLVPKGEMYSLELHDDTQHYEVATTTFSDFRPSGVTSDGMTLLCSYGNFDGDAPPENPEFVKMVLRRTNSMGERNNRDVNYGEWMLTLTGKGEKIDIMKRYIVGAREPVFWRSTDAMVFRGYSEQEKTPSANQP